MSSNDRETDANREHPTFTVDTHLFRELGELLVGRDSTALVELVKNSYDADATEVIVYGERLSSASQGYISVRDNGTGMGRKEFEAGFLRIASRTKESGERRSEKLGRRYTGAKGIGRLAAHKLAHVLEVVSFRANSSQRIPATGIEAKIQWDVVENFSTLEKLTGSEAVTVHDVTPGSGATSGTTITLRRLRSSWSKAAHARFLEEIQTFGPSAALVDPLPRNVVLRRLLFDHAVVRDSNAAKGAVFDVRLDGELAPPEGFFQAKVEAASWVLEIDATERTGAVRYAIAPTKDTAKDLPDAERQEYSIDHPAPKEGPFFQARILIRTGRAWEARTSGVRVFMEGFRILPYGESRNDWLGIDRDVTERGRGRLLSSSAEDLNAVLGEGDAAKDAALLILPNKHYFGGVFLTQHGGRNLRTLVNREGFVPDSAYETLTTLVRGGIDLATRVRAAASEQQREERRKSRAKGRRGAPSPEAEVVPSTSLLRTAISQASTSATEVRRLLAAGNVGAAEKKLAETLEHVAGLEDVSGDIIGELAMIRVLASVGTQMAGFVHEINSLVGTAESVDTALRNLRDASQRSARSARETRDLALIVRTMGDLRRNLERQASYLVDVVTPDARRRRSRLKLSERFDAGARLVAHVAEARRTQIQNRIPADLTSPPMFAAELTTIFSNLLTNAVKAAGEDGVIRATGKRTADGITLRLENTGTAVSPAKGERWFRPFESSTTRVDAVLGQGMGLGLPITRSMLAEYGGSIKFVEPSTSFSTALEIVLPVRS
jgi:signal transduction histidine kinase